MQRIKVDSYDDVVSVINLLSSAIIKGLEKSVKRDDLVSSLSAINQHAMSQSLSYKMKSGEYVAGHLPLETGVENPDASNEE